MPKPNYWTAEEAAEARRLSEQGMTGAQIAERLGRSKSGTNKLRSRGWVIAERSGPPKPAYRPMPNDYAAVRTTLNVNQARRHYGTSNGAIRRWDKEAGVTAHKPGRKAQKPVRITTPRAPLWTDAEDAVLREKLGCDWSYIDIAPLLPGRTMQAVRRRAKTLGIGLTDEARRRVNSKAAVKSNANRVYAPKPSRAASQWRDRSLTRGKSFAPVVVLTSAQEAQRVLQRVGPVFCMAVYNPKLTDEWSVFGVRMSTSEMMEKAEAQRRTA